MADEYAIDPKLFAQSLVEQRKMRLTGGLYHLNQVELAYNSNRIEGGQLTVEQTRYIYETKTVVGPALIDDVIETTNHFRMFDLMLDSIAVPLSADLIKEYHQLLKTGTTHATKDWFEVGDWKRMPSTVEGIETTAPAGVADAIADLLAAYPPTRRLSFNDICDFHFAFEKIHPFQDGNGRVGRLILFAHCLANDLMPFIVLGDEKYFYYRGLAQYDSEPDFLRDTFRHFQDRYYETYSQYVPLIDGGQTSP